MLKELSSKRLAADQQHFANVVAFLFDHIWGQWCADAQAVLSALPAALLSHAAGQPLLLSCERWLLLLKIVRRLILFGSPSDAKTLQPVQAVILCVPAMVQALRQLVAARQGSGGGVGADGAAAKQPPRSQLGVMLERVALKLLKTQRQVQEAHPWSYHAAGALLDMMGFSCAQLMGAVGARGGSENQQALLTHAAAFLLNVHNCAAYKGKSAGGALVTAGSASAQAAGPDGIKALAGQVQPALDAFWSTDRLTALTSIILQHYFPLGEEQLASWQVCSAASLHRRGN